MGDLPRAGRQKAPVLAARLGAVAGDGDGGRGGEEGAEGAEGVAGGAVLALVDVREPGGGGQGGEGGAFAGPGTGPEGGEAELEARGRPPLVAVEHVAEGPLADLAVPGREAADGVGEGGEGAHEVVGLLEEGGEAGGWPGEGKDVRQKYGRIAEDYVLSFGASQNWNAFDTVALLRRHLINMADVKFVAKKDIVTKPFLMISVTLMC